MSYSSRCEKPSCDQSGSACPILRYTTAAVSAIAYRVAWVRPVSLEKFTGTTVKAVISPSTTASTFAASRTTVKRPRLSSSAITAWVTWAARPCLPVRS